jgi:hypothetical protein
MSLFQTVSQLILLDMFSGINGANSEYVKSALTIQSQLQIHEGLE